MASESGREQLNQFFSTYKSSKVAYEGFTFVKEVEAKDCDLIIEFYKNAGDRLIKITGQNGEINTIGGQLDMLESGPYAVRIQKGTKSTIRFPITDVTNTLIHYY